MSKKINITPSDVKKLAEECKNIAESLSFETPLISEENITEKVKITPMGEASRYKNLFEYSIPTDDNRDNITESKKEADIYNMIVRDLENELNSIDELDVIEEGVLDVLRKYVGKKVMTVGIILQLLSAGKATAQQLQQAGVEPEKIEVAMDQLQSDRQGRPQYFNFANVKAISVKDTISAEDVESLRRTFTFVTYQSSSDYDFENVPYTLTTSEGMTNAAGKWTVSTTINYSKFNKTQVSDTTEAARRDFYIVANADRSDITYTVSDYPMEITNDNGDTLKFLGIQVWKGEARNKTPFYNSSMGVEAARTKSEGSYFQRAEGQSSVTIKANSVSINLIYGVGFEETTKTVAPKPVEMKSGNLFKYNKTDVNTTSQDYQDMLENAYKQLTENPPGKDYTWTLNVHGSSSQVPTNYPTLSGEKTIDANKQLAHDRAKSLGMQLLKDLKAKGIDVSKIKKGKISSVIGDTEYQNDPTNVARYAPDQFAAITLTPSK